MRSCLYFESDTKSATYCRFNTDSTSVFVRMMVHCCSLVKNIHPK